MPIPNPTDRVQTAIQAMPLAPRARVLEIRALIFEAANSVGVSPLVETLKWGQPSYLPSPRSAGTTIRLGWSDKSPDVVGLYVHCQTNLVSRYRDLYGDALSYDGNRGVLFSIKVDLPKTALLQMAGMALTYHRQKRS